MKSHSSAFLIALACVVGTCRPSHAVTIAEWDLNTAIYFTTLQPPPGVDFPQRHLLFASHFLTHDMNADIVGDGSLPASFHPLLDAFNMPDIDGRPAYYPNMVPIPLSAIPAVDVDGNPIETWTLINDGVPTEITLFGLPPHDENGVAIYSFTQLQAAVSQYVDDLEAATSESFFASIAHPALGATIATDFFNVSVSDFPSESHYHSGTIFSRLYETQVMLSAVPEPTTLALFPAGLAGLLLLRRLSRRAT